MQREQSIAAGGRRLAVASDSRGRMDVVVEVVEVVVRVGVAERVKLVGCIPAKAPAKHQRSTSPTRADTALLRAGWGKAD